MKLRDRKKGVLSNVKQEDRKFEFIITEATSTSIVANNGINTFDLNIKQEDTKKYSNLLQQNATTLYSSISTEENKSDSRRR
ncbi:hypothetical protein PS15p_206728 [Mucor circinelloides]